MRHHCLRQLLKHLWGKGLGHSILEILQDQSLVSLKIDPGLSIALAPFPPLSFTEVAPNRTVGIILPGPRNKKRLSHPWSQEQKALDLGAGDRT